VSFARVHRCSVVVSALWLALGCRSADRQADRAEAGKLVHAIQTVRRASPTEKARPLAELERVACSSDRCDAKDRCVAAYRAHVRGTDRLAEARRALGVSDAPVNDSATKLLMLAQQDLERSVALAKECADLEGDLARRYKVE
jgi:head-tail adaptor